MTSFVYMDFNPAHIHLIVNHLPVFGTILGSIVLLQGLLQRNNQVQVAAYNLFILSAIGAIITYTSGHGAEEMIEKIPGVAENMIEAHEDFALFALIASSILGAASLAGLFINVMNLKFSRSFAVIAVILAAINCLILVYTGFLGGKIRHSEIHTSGGIIQSSEGADQGNATEEEFESD